MNTVTPVFAPAASAFRQAASELEQFLFISWRASQANSIDLELCSPLWLPFAYNHGMDSLRLDKWLWAARFFKTRSLAARACELGRVQCGKQPVKPGRTLRAGEILWIRTEGGEFEVEVLILNEIRGPAAIAQTLYRETESSRERKMKITQERRSGMLFNPASENRPSKRDRRKIRELRGE